MNCVEERLDSDAGKALAACICADNPQGACEHFCLPGSGGGGSGGMGGSSSGGMGGSGG